MSGNRTVTYTKDTGASQQGATPVRGLGAAELAVSKAADALLAQAKASGWAPLVPQGGEWCGECTPCRDGATNECIHRGTRHAAAKQLARERDGRQELTRVAPSIDEQIAEIEASVTVTRSQLEAEASRTWVWAG